MDKKEIIHALEEISLLLELKGEDKFKAVAYSRAARSLSQTTSDVVGLIQKGEARKIPGIGETLSKKLSEFVETGRISYLEELKSSFPPGLTELFEIQGLGPNKVRALYEELDIKSLSELEYACHENRLVTLKGFGKKTQDKILAEIEKVKANSEYHLLNVIHATANEISAALEKLSGVEKYEFTGSYRRRREIIRDIDCVIKFKSGERDKLFASLQKLKGVKEVKDVQNDFVSVIWENGIQVEFIITNKAENPFAILHSTGSKEFYQSLREYASSRGYTLLSNELKKGKEKLQFESEEDIFSELGLQFIPPELREDGDAVRAASKGEIPKLIELEDIIGVFHVHTNWSDGADSIEDMVKAARKLGLKYLGLSDHSKVAIYANGLDEKRLKEQSDAVDKINAVQKDFFVFKGSEVDILSDGKLDFGDGVLKKLDFSVGSVHSRLGMKKDEATKRLVSAMKNPYLTILGHMTGRLLLGRNGYEVDVDDIIKTASRNKKVIEINANPHRLDIDWRNIKKAKEAGVKFSINPDAHSKAGLADFIYGVYIARKGWLTRDDLLNTMDVDRVKKFLKNAKG
ncbi:MAG TPA: DNA polymerase/3'-5' exonuclease PolX [Candidatus Acidoferrales bacterium]|nr:DNA polymerase/3'-5' exonuclease PolX [Candidatus Acidoferrales bacterium]